MPKKPKTPEPADDEPKFLTVVHPYPLHANWELFQDRVEFALWFACCVDPQSFYAFYYKPSAPNMVIVEIARNFDGFDRVLGEHRWSEVLQNPSDEEKGRATRIYYCKFTTCRQVQKTGWKTITVEDAWFTHWSAHNSKVKYPYPATYYCEVPVEDRTNAPMCRPLPRVSFPPPPKVPPPVVGSATWVNTKSGGVGAPPSRALPIRGGIARVGSASSTSGNPRGVRKEPIPAASISTAKAWDIPLLSSKVSTTTESSTTDEPSVIFDMGESGPVLSERAVFSKNSFNWADEPCEVLDTSENVIQNTTAEPILIAESLETMLRNVAVNDDEDEEEFLDHLGAWEVPQPTDDPWGAQNNDPWGALAHGAWGAQNNDAWGAQNNDAWGAQNNDAWGAQNNDDWDLPHVNDEAPVELEQTPQQPEKIICRVHGLICKPKICLEYAKQERELKIKLRIENESNGQGSKEAKALKSKTKAKALASRGRGGKPEQGRTSSASVQGSFSGRASVASRSSSTQPSAGAGGWGTDPKVRTLTAAGRLGPGGASKASKPSEGTGELGIGPKPKTAASTPAGGWGTGVRKSTPRPALPQDAKSSSSSAEEPVTPDHDGRRLSNARGRSRKDSDASSAAPSTTGGWGNISNGPW